MLTLFAHEGMVVGPTHCEKWYAFAKARCIGHTSSFFILSTARPISPFLKMGEICPVSFMIRAKTCREIVKVLHGRRTYSGWDLSVMYSTLINFDIL